MVGGVALEQVTRALWQEAATALRDIREVCPEVAPAMIMAAAARYRAKWPKATLSPSALAKHWGAFGGEKKEEKAKKIELNYSPCPVAILAIIYKLKLICQRSRRTLFARQNSLSLFGATRGGLFSGVTFPT